MKNRGAAAQYQLIRRIIRETRLGQIKASADLPNAYRGPHKVRRGIDGNGSDDFVSKKHASKGHEYCKTGEKWNSEAPVRHPTSEQRQPVVGEI